MPSQDRTIDVVLCWHMHQPSYLVNGVFTAPWVYLHGLKDYSDMAAHLELVPGARAVVNFVPVLLEQLEVYNERLARHVAGVPDLGDPLLDALASGLIPEDPAERLELIRSCFQVNEHRVLARYPRYAELSRIAAPLGVDHAAYLSDQFVVDSLVWLHLGWLGEGIRHGDERARRLEAKGSQFDASDRETMLRIVTDELAGLMPRYAALAQSGKVELSMSPWGHPILPLLLSFDAAREAMPDVVLPAAAGEYPQGEARARWHLERGLEVFTRHFGRRPSGCWPPEGALSNDTLGLLSDMGFRWTASGGGVLGNSLSAHGLDPGCGHVPFRPDSGHDLRCFFRDDTLSDLVGFAYKDWAASDAVDDLVGRLEGIARICDHPKPVVSIILDGENAWEHYHHNGWEFLELLYSRLAEHPRLRLTTFESLLDGEPGDGEPLPGIVCGSWVYGTLSTWIGDPDKNRAWDQLIAAKREYDQHADAAADADATELLAVCEASDWFWWLGDHHAAATVRRFERLFRSHLRALYGALSVQEPGLDDQPRSRGGEGEPGGGTMLPSRRH